MEHPKVIYYAHRCIEPSGFAAGTAYEQKPLVESSEKFIRADLLSGFAETVRRYVCPKKGDKFCSRSELLGKLAQLNELINGKEEIKRPDQTQPV